MFSVLLIEKKAYHKKTAWRFDVQATEGVRVLDRPHNRLLELVLEVALAADLAPHDLGYVERDLAHRTRLHHPQRHVQVVGRDCGSVR